MTDLAALEALERRVVECRKCPRLVEWREKVAREKRAAFATEEYWGRPVPPFGDPAGRLLIVGLAPAAHGGNRTGRMFTGDRSGDWLYASMHRTGFANQPHATSKDDGLALIDAYITAPVRCAPPANKPTLEERDTCLNYLVRELGLLPNVTVVIALGKFAWDATLKVMAMAGEIMPRPKPMPASGAAIRSILPRGSANTKVMPTTECPRPAGERRAARRRSRPPSRA